MRLSLLLACLASSAAGCLLQDRGVAVGPSAQSHSPADLAHLGGYVWKIDGRDIDESAGRFDLAPGCHLVTTPTQWARAQAAAGGVIVQTGHITYAIDMRAGFFYSIEVQPLESNSGPIGRALVHASEIGGDGSVMRTFPEATRAVDSSTCKEVRMRPSLVPAD